MDFSCTKFSAVKSLYAVCRVPSVLLYLEDKIKFYDIAELISYATEKAQNGEVTYDNLVFADAEARRAVQKKAECEN